MSAGTASGIVARGATAAARSLPTLLTATEWWTQTVIASGAMTGQRATGMDLQLGSTSGADANDPTVTDSATHRYLAFDGTNDYCQIAAGSAGALDVGEDVDFTIVTVVRHQGSAAAQVLFEKGHGSEFGYRMQILPNGIARAALRNTSGVNNTVDTAAALSTGVDYIVAQRRSGTTLSIVLDDASADVATTASSAANAAAPVFHGAAGAPAGALPLNGRSYGCAAWIGTALTDDQTVTAGKELLAVARL